MPFVVADIIQEAADLVGDPLKSRIKPAQWLRLFNRAHRKLTSRIECVEIESFFDLQNDDRYAYPGDLVSVTEMRVTDTPTDPDTYFAHVLDDLSRDRFRERTRGGYPSATLPDAYYPATGWFQLVPKPSATIVNGGIIRYFAQATPVTSDVVPVESPDAAHDHLVDALLIQAHGQLKEFEEARERERMWYEQEPAIKESVEDRSKDRPTSFRPAAGPFSAESQV